MSGAQRTLSTRRGTIRYPAYIPVTTFGARYPLDDLVRPYLPRLAQAVMVSYHYAWQMEERPPLPLMVDSGGFVSLFEHARLVKSGSLGVLKVRREDGVENIHPRDVLDFQERVADVAFTLDFPIPLGSDIKEAGRRQKLTIANAQWALVNRRRKDLPLFACVQAWDAASAETCAREYKSAGFDGLAIGGLVPRARNFSKIQAIIDAVKSEVSDLPLHVFGLGNPDIIPLLFGAGVDSVDSSSYVQYAADGRLWGEPHYRIEDPSPSDRLNLALCNLANAVGRSLPLSCARMFFSTANRVTQEGRS